jgi:hypothetical protein
MGTYGIFQTLLNHWKYSTNPIYRAESRHTRLLPGARLTWRFVQRIWRPIAAVVTVVLATTAADFFCSGSRILPLSLSNALLTLFSVVGGGLVLVAVMLFAYLWPVAVAVNASGIVVQERERQTWDLLLTTPFDRADVLLAKLASSLRLFNPYGEMLLWVQSFLAVILSVLIVSSLPQSGSYLVKIAITALALIEFFAGRVQDYVLSSLLGVMASLLAGTREAAWAMATMLALIPILVRAALTIVVIALMSPQQSFAKFAVLLATGPGSAIVLEWPVPLAALILIALVIVREGLIRLLFRWLVRRLGDAPHRTTV